MNANLGGTEMYSCLQHVYERLACYLGYSRNIFLITDGCVGNEK